MARNVMVLDLVSKQELTYSLHRDVRLKCIEQYIYTRFTFCIFDHLCAVHDDVGKDVHGESENVEVGERHERSFRIQHIVFVAQHERRETQDCHLNEPKNLKYFQKSGMIL